MRFLRFVLVYLTFVPLLGLTQKRINLTPKFIFQRDRSINHYGYGFTVDYDNLKKKKRFSFNTGLGMFNIRGKKYYEVDSTFLKNVIPNGTPNRPYYVISRQFGITIPISLKMQVMKKERSEFDVSLGIIPTTNFINVNSGEYYIRPWFRDSTFRAGPYPYKNNSNKNRNIIHLDAIPIFLTTEYLTNYSKSNQLNFRFTIARRIVKYFKDSKDNLYISLELGIRLNRKNYSR